MPGHIDHRERQDRDIFSKKRIRDDCTDHGKEICACNKEMHPLARLSVGHVIRAATRTHQILRHENHQDGLHSIERKSLSRFISNDVWNALWHSRGIGRCSSVLTRHMLDGYNVISNSRTQRSQSAPTTAAACATGSSPVCVALISTAAAP